MVATKPNPGEIPYFIGSIYIYIPSFGGGVKKYQLMIIRIVIHDP